MNDETAAKTLVEFSAIAKEAERCIASVPQKAVSYDWLSDTDTDRMVDRFSTIARVTAQAPLSEASVRSLPDGYRGSFALVNGRGAALYSYSHWVGGAPGDALLQRFVLLLEDGSSVDATVVDSCTQDTIEFLLRGATTERLEQLTLAIEEALRETPSVAPDWLKR